MTLVQDTGNLFENNGKRKDVWTQEDDACVVYGYQNPL